MFIRTKAQEYLFTAMMVVPMAYCMIVYNTAVNVGGLHSILFLEALKELWIMAPIAFVLEAFVVARIVHWGVPKILDFRKTPPLLITLCTSSIIVAIMCPTMSLIGTLLFGHTDGDFIAAWLQTFALGFPAALLWQIFFCGPLVRFLFRRIFGKRNAAAAAAEQAKAKAAAVSPEQE